MERGQLQFKTQFSSKVLNSWTPYEENLTQWALLDRRNYMHRSLSWQVTAVGAYQERKCAKRINGSEKLLNFDWGYVCCQSVSRLISQTELVCRDEPFHICEYLS